MDEAEKSDHYEEMMSFFDNWEKEREEANQKGHRFINQLSTEIIDLSIQYLPELEPHRYKFTGPLQEKLADCGFGLIDLLESMLTLCEGSEYDCPENKVPKRNLSEEDRIYRENTLKNMPPEQHAFFISIDDPRVEQDAFERELIFQWHDKIKEILFIHYPAIADLSPNNLRFLDFSSYVDALTYIHDLYYFAGEYITDRFPWPD